MLSEKPWRDDAVLRLIALILLSYVLAAALAGVLTSAGLAKKIDNGSFLAFAVLTSIFHICALLFIRGFLREHNLKWSQAFGLFSPSLGRNLLLAILAAIVVLPLTHALTQLSVRALAWFHLEAREQSTVQTLKSSVSWDQRIFFGIIAIIFAPLVEEFLFRGILYPTLKQKGYRRLALWGTSVFFAMTHSNLPTFIPLIFLALILTFLYEETNTLLAPILTHSLFNAANFYWLLRQQALGLAN
jgi:membrane protease YdiL (CAAX protease family)